MNVNDLIMFSKNIIDEFKLFFREIEDDNLKNKSRDFPINKELCLMNNINYDYLIDLVNDYIADFINEHIVKLPIYKKMKEKIIRKYEKNFPEIDKRNYIALDEEDKNTTFIIDHVFYFFLSPILEDLVQGKLNDNKIIDYCSLLLSELNLANYDYNQYIFLKSIDFSSPEIVINGEAKITKLSHVINKIKNNDSPRFHSDIQYHHRLPILHIQTNCYDTIELNNEKFGLFNALTLYRLSNIKISAEYMEKNSILTIESRDEFLNYRKNKERNSNLDFKIEKDQEKHFSNFLKDLSKIIMLKNDSRKVLKPDSTIFLALDRYNRGLPDDADLERKILDVIMGFEPLFTTEDERGENSYKIAMRAAKLLSFFDLKSNVYENLKDAYTIRNAVVHGGKYRTELKDKVMNIYYNVLNYLRISLLVFFLKYKTKKKDFINLINESMIDQSVNKKLESFIKKIPSDYKINFSELNIDDLTYDTIYYYY
ncbi:MAG: hypothetical protein ACTSO7_16665 [Candidatus Heimdallarchaeota archaeon]